MNENVMKTLGSISWMPWMPVENLMKLGSNMATMGNPTASPGLTALASFDWCGCCASSASRGLPGRALERKMENRTAMIPNASCRFRMVYDDSGWFMLWWFRMVYDGLIMMVQDGSATFTMLEEGNCNVLWCFGFDDNWSRSQLVDVGGDWWRVRMVDG